MLFQTTLTQAKVLLLHAGTTLAPVTNDTPFQPVDTSTVIQKLFDAFMEYVPYVAGILALGVIIWVGFRLIVSAGDPKKLEDAQKSLMNVVIGIIIIICSYLILTTGLAVAQYIRGNI